MGGSSSEIYSIESNQWTKAPDLNDWRCNHSAVCNGRFVYIFGGNQPEYGCVKTKIRTGIISVERLNMQDIEAGWKQLNMIKK